jgi:peptidoglycan/xylan/chitin deacetylase (PgdA/CDA1 family)
MSIRANSYQPDFGALVFSIDFELHWGIRDVQSADGNYRANLLGEREAVPLMLKVFREYGIAATWATVGFLFAHSRDELQAQMPDIKPQYTDVSLSPYNEVIGYDEREDPLHYAPTLIKQIQETPNQEVGTHTFSHYYCLEQGQTKETFRADLQTAVAFAAKYGVQLSSIVFPRNQVNPEYLDVLLSEGLICYRGNENHWLYLCHEQPGTWHPPQVRIGRLLDSYSNLSGSHLITWDQVETPSGICNIPASRFLRPYKSSLKPLEQLRLQRITNAMREAATTKKIFHLWTHSHNLGVDMNENLTFLRAVCAEYKRLQQSHGMRSLTMHDAARLARGET